MPCAYQRKAIRNRGWVRKNTTELLRCIAEDTSISILSATIAMKLLKLWMYKASVVHVLQLHEGQSLHNDEELKEYTERSFWKFLGKNLGEFQHV
jgi:hypothetical protein